MIKLLDRLALPIGIVLLAGLLVGAFWLNRQLPTKAVANIELTVDVAGAVNQPGVYRFSSGALVEDAITKAGGFTTDVDLNLVALTINRAALLANNGKVYIPRMGATNTNTSPTAPSATALVNINTADAATLDTLPGIGPVYAGRIIEYRTKSGAFKRKEDLMKVSGISSSTYSKLKDRITI